MKPPFKEYQPTIAQVPSDPKMPAPASTARPIIPKKPSSTHVPSSAPGGDGNQGLSSTCLADQMGQKTRSTMQKAQDLHREMTADYVRTVREGPPTAGGVKDDDEYRTDSSATSEDDQQSDHRRLTNTKQVEAQAICQATSTQRSPRSVLSQASHTDISLS